MKTLTRLDDKPELIEEVNEQVLETIPTFRKWLKIIAGNSKPKPGTDESIDLYQIGLKLKMDGDVALEDAEFKLLESKVKENPTDIRSHVLGQVLLKFREAEKR